jgi:hypothetical protein
VSDNGRWYWLDAPGLAWVRGNLPGVRIERHRRVKFSRLAEKEQHNAEAVQFPPGGLTKTRRAGFKPREVTVETICGACKRAYMPYYEDDPCIVGLPGVRFACDGEQRHRGQSYQVAKSFDIEPAGEDLKVAAKSHFLTWSRRYWRPVKHRESPAGL